MKTITTVCLVLLSASAFASGGSDSYSLESNPQTIAKLCGFQDFQANVGDYSAYSSSSNAVIEPLIKNGDGVLRCLYKAQTLAFKQGDLHAEKENLVLINALTFELTTLSVIEIHNSDHL
jgi:hypothetical protein